MNFLNNINLEDINFDEIDIDIDLNCNNEDLNQFFIRSDEDIINIGDVIINIDELEEGLFITSDDDLSEIDIKIIDNIEDIESINIYVDENNNKKLDISLVDDLDEDKSDDFYIIDDEVLKLALSSAKKK